MQQVSRSGLQPESIASIDCLIEAMKQAQASKPCARFTLSIDGAEFGVSLLPSGYIELDGRVPTLAFEREFDRVLATAGATLITIN